MPDIANTTLNLQLEFADEDVRKAVEAKIRSVALQVSIEMLARGDFQYTVQQHVRDLFRTQEFRAAVNDALLRNAQHIQFNVP